MQTGNTHRVFVTFSERISNRVLLVLAMEVGTLLIALIFNQAIDASSGSFFVSSLKVANLKLTFHSYTQSIPILRASTEWCYVSVQNEFKHTKLILPQKKDIQSLPL